MPSLLALECLNIRMRLLPHRRYHSYPHKVLVALAFSTSRQQSPLRFRRVLLMARLRLRPSHPLFLLSRASTLTSAQRFKGLNLFIFLATACSSSSTLPLTLTHVGLHGLIEKSTSYTTLGAFQFLPAMPQSIVYTLPHIECYTCCRIVYTLPKIECYTSSRIVYTLPKIGCYAVVFFWPSLLWPVF